LVASDGGVFTFGDAGFYGSLGGVRLARPVVGTAATPDGRGYWLVAADGGVFTFGDAPFRGALAGRTTADIVGMTASGPSGYWLVGAVPGATAAAEQMILDNFVAFRLASVRFPDGQQFTMVSGLCQGTGDGHCWSEFFFLDSTAVGATATVHGPPIPVVAPAGLAANPPMLATRPATGQISAGYPTTTAGRPLCCPNGPADTYLYRWNGAAVVTQGSPPRPPYSFG
jgi:hypothetical protein